MRITRITINILLVFCQEKIMSTIRQQIIALLEANTGDARMISQSLGLSEKEVTTHIPHIRKTVAAMGKSLVVMPARCITCGYEFETREKITKPGRCPRCKKERIDPPAFQIV